MKRIYLLLALIWPVFLHGQVISTIVGNGSSGYTGDGGLATTAQLNNPWGVAVDKYGNIYIADQGNNAIRKVNPVAGGYITTVAGGIILGGPLRDGFPATTAPLSNPYSVAVDNTGNIFIADPGDTRIRMVDTAGNMNTVAGGAWGPGSIGDGGPATDAWLDHPTSVIVDHAGNIYISDEGHNRIRMVNTSGIINTLVGDGTVGFSGDGGPATAAEISGVYSLALDNSDNLYFTDGGNICVRKVNHSTGIITTIAGIPGSYGYSGDGGPATSALLYGPNAVAINKYGEIFIGESGNMRVRKIGISGIISTVVGDGYGAGGTTGGFSGDGGPATAAELGTPLGLAFDTCGNLYIGDRTNQRIRKVKFDPSCSFPGSVSMSGPARVCVGATITLASSLPGGTWTSGSPGVAYFFGGGSTLKGWSAGSTLISYTLGAVTDTQTVVVYPAPNAGSIVGPDTACYPLAGSTITTLTDTVSGGTWLSSSSSFTVSGGIISGAGGGGVVTIRYAVSNSCGHDTASHTLDVVICPDEVNTLPQQLNHITLYPNPAVTSLAISSLYPITTISVSDLIGQTILTRQDSGRNVHLDISGLPAGVYFVKINGMEVKKFVKQ